LCAFLLRVFSPPNPHYRYLAVARAFVKHQHLQHLLAALAALAALQHHDIHRLSDSSSSPSSFRISFHNAQHSSAFTLHLSQSHPTCPIQSSCPPRSPMPGTYTEQFLIRPTTILIQLQQ